MLLDAAMYRLTPELCGGWEQCEYNVTMAAGRAGIVTRRWELLMSRYAVQCGGSSHSGGIDLGTRIKHAGAPGITGQGHVGAGTLLPNMLICFKYHQICVYSNHI